MKLFSTIFVCRLLISTSTDLARLRAKTGWTSEVVSTFLSCLWQLNFDSVIRKSYWKSRVAIKRSMLRLNQSLIPSMISDHLAFESRWNILYFYFVLPYWISKICTSGVISYTVRICQRGSTRFKRLYWFHNGLFQSKTIHPLWEPLLLVLITWPSKPNRRHLFLLLVLLLMLWRRAHDIYFFR